MTISLGELARSLELYNLVLDLQEEAGKGNPELIFTKSPLQKVMPSAVVVAMGSFDPLTTAHTYLFRLGQVQALHSLEPPVQDPLPHRFPELLIVSSICHADKKIDWTKNASIEDRIQSLEIYASCAGNTRIGAANVSLFRDLVPLVESAYPPGTNLFFFTGADVMNKILDLSYYPGGVGDLEDALKTIFKQRFIIAPRKLRGQQQQTGEQHHQTGGQQHQKGEESIPEYQLVTGTMIVNSHPELEQYRSRIISIPPADHIFRAGGCLLSEMSATKVRELRRKRVIPLEMEAIGTSEFISQRHLYEENDYYQALVLLRHEFVDLHRNNKGRAGGIMELYNDIDRLGGSKEFRSISKSH